MILTERAFSDGLKLLSDFKNPLKVIVAFSGGCDSLALLVLCAKALGKENTVPVYVNHRLRSDEELEEEIRLNRENCKKLSLELTVCDLGKKSVEEVSRQRKGGVEDAARYLRYQELERCRVEKGCDYIVTAHHMQDQVETVLMKMMRNAPEASLRGISERDGKILRPLLDYSREELERYLEERGFSWSTDSTNNETDYERNDIRLNVLPELKKQMPDCEKRILKIRDAAFNMCLNPSYVREEGKALDREGFNTLNEVQKTVALYDYWDSIFGYRSMPQTLTERIIEAAEGRNSNTVAANGALVIIGNKEIVIKDAEEAGKNLDFNCILTKHAKIQMPTSIICEVSDRGRDTDIRLDESLFDRNELSLRYVKEGDRIKLKDGSKMVLRLLQDMKIPSALRYRVPVICDSEGVCAVAGEVLGGRNRVALRCLDSASQNNCVIYVKFIL